MPSFGADNKPIHGRQLVLAPSAARTTSGNGDSQSAETEDSLRLTLDVTAASGGTPSLTVTVQNSVDGTTWVTHSAFTAKTGTGTERKVFAGIDRFVRVIWAITGTTPSFTFSVAGEAV